MKFELLPDADQETIVAAFDVWLARNNGRASLFDAWRDAAALFGNQDCNLVQRFADMLDKYQLLLERMEATRIRANHPEIQA